MSRFLQSMRTRAIVLFLLCSISAVTFAGLLALKPSVPQSTTILPSDHPAAAQFSAWLAAFNTADEDALLSYHNRSDIGNIDRELNFARFTGGFDVADVESTSDPSAVVVLLKEKNRPIYARAAMHVDIFKPNYSAKQFEIRRIITPLKFIPKDDPRRPKWEKALKPLTPALRRAVVEGVAELLREQYIDPELGEEMVAGLKARLKTNDYARVYDSESFAQLLTDDLHNMSQDLHIHVAFVEPHPELLEGDDGDKPGKHLDDLSRVNFGFGTVSFDIDSVPRRTIATLPIYAFVPSTAEFASDWQEIRTAIGTILTGIALADALLVDLRSNHGGDPHTIAFILSYLLDDGPVHLLDFVNRSGAIDTSFYTIPAHELPSGTRRFGGTKPVYVLTTNWTVSGGEDMAYSLQAFNRASAIIGEGNEATAGAANPLTNPRFICEEEFGSGWWFVGVPNVRPIHAVTGTNWEREGVKSDIVAGRGEWEGVSDAQEVGRMLAAQDLKGPGKKEA